MLLELLQLHNLEHLHKTHMVQEQLELALLLVEAMEISIISIKEIL